MDRPLLGHHEPDGQQLSIPQAQTPCQVESEDLEAQTPRTSSTTSGKSGISCETRGLYDLNEEVTSSSPDAPRAHGSSSPSSVSDYDVGPIVDYSPPSLDQQIAQLRREAEAEAEERREEAVAAQKIKKKRAKPSSAPEETQGERKRRKKEEYRKEREEERSQGKKPATSTTPRDAVFEAMERHKAKANDGSAEALKQLSTEPPTEAQIARLKEVSALGPPYLGRTASRKPGHKFLKHKRATNGWTTEALMLPGADVTEGQAVHDSMTAIPQGAMLYMLGTHLIWQDMLSDELLSTSKDFCFLIIHALDRYNEGQGGVTIQIVDRRTAKDTLGRPAVFYQALDLCEIYEVQKWPGWWNTAQIGLHPRKFTQEFLSHGPVILDTGAMRQAPIEDLIRDGLYTIYPFLAIPDGHERVGLYSGQVQSHKAGFPPDTAPTARGASLYTYASSASPLTVELLGVNRKMTMNFMRIPEGVDESSMEPHLHVFLGFLTLQKRQTNDAVLMEWISKRYRASDVENLYLTPDGTVYPGFTTVANNLPSYMQYLDLVRDCIALFSLPIQLPENEVQEQHAFHDWAGRDYRYAAGDNKHNRRDVMSIPFDQEAVLDKREMFKGRKKAKADATRQEIELRGTEDEQRPESALTVSSEDSPRASPASDIGSSQIAPEAIPAIINDAIHDTADETEHLVGEGEAFANYLPDLSDHDLMEEDMFRRAVSRESDDGFFQKPPRRMSDGSRDDFDGLPASPRELQEMW